MECATVSVDVDEYCTTLRQDIRTARKQHKCGECKKPILPGDKYEDYVGVFDGEIFKHKTCNDCISLRKSFFSDGYYYGMIREQLSEHIRECYGEISESNISELQPAAREWVCHEIEDYWESYEDCEITNYNQPQRGTP